MCRGVVTRSKIHIRLLLVNLASGYTEHRSAVTLNWIDTGYRNTFGLSIYFCQNRCSLSPLPGLGYPLP